MYALLVGAVASLLAETKAPSKIDDVKAPFRAVDFITMAKAPEKSEGYNLAVGIISGVAAEGYWNSKICLSGSNDHVLDLVVADMEKAIDSHRATGNEDWRYIVPTLLEGSYPCKGEK